MKCPSCGSTPELIVSAASEAAVLHCPAERRSWACQSFDEGPNLFWPIEGRELEAGLVGAGR